MTHVIIREVQGTTRKQQGDPIKSKNGGTVQKGFPEQATFY